MFNNCHRCGKIIADDGTIVCKECREKTFGYKGIKGALKCSCCGEEAEVLVNERCEKCALDLRYYKNCEKRLQHLLKSKFIRAYDKKKPNGEYERNILDADIQTLEKELGLDDKAGGKKLVVKLATVAGWLDAVACMEGAPISKELAQSANTACAMICKLAKELIE